jgi:hypothetical protein
MYTEKPLVMYSKNHDGRHWLTTLEFPPIQIAPVAANHCRVAYFLATLISSKLIKYESKKLYTRRCISIKCIVWNVS